jgi:hypothetical protein
MLGYELFIETAGLFKFQQFLVERLPPDEYAVITRLIEEYLTISLDEYVLHAAVHELG